MHRKQGRALRHAVDSVTLGPERILQWQRQSGAMYV